MTRIGTNGKTAAVWELTPELREIADTDSSMLPELVALFLNDSTARLQILGEACGRQDSRIVQAQAHSLKGSAIQMGAGGLASLCATLELRGRSEPERCAPMLQAIDDEFLLVRQAMEGFLISVER